MPMLPQYKETYEQLKKAIIADNEDEVKELLREHGLRSREQVVLGTGENNNSDPISVLKVWHPVSIAVVYQSIKSLNVILDYQNDLICMQENGNNLIHLLLHSASDTDEDIQIYDAIIQRWGPDKKRILLGRNSHGLTPLELSVKLKRIKFFEAILYTDDVYRRVLEQEGKVQTNEFTFHYPDAKSEASSFLWQITLLPPDSDSGAFIRKVVKLPVIKQLATRKLRRNLIVILLWAILRLVPLAMFQFLFISQEDVACFYHRVLGPRTKFAIPFETAWGIAEGEYNKKHFSLQVVYKNLSMALGLIYLIFDVIEAVYIVRTSNSIGDLWEELKSPRVVNIVFYRINSFLFILSGYYFLITKAFDDETPMGMETTHSLVVYVLLCFQVLYFAQICPIVGSFSIGFQKMLGPLCNFLLLQLIVMSVFVNLFNRVLLLLCRPRSGTQCFLSFNIYYIFGLMLNTVEPIPDNSVCEEIGITILQVLYFIYIFIVAVMIVNYLIAVMSSVYEDYSEYEGGAVFLHRLHMSLVVERRMRMATSCFSRCRGPRSDVIKTAEVDHRSPRATSSSPAEKVNDDEKTVPDDAPKLYDSEGNGMLF